MLLSRLEALRRNWHAAAAGFVATTILAVVAAMLVPATYVASQQVVLLPPHTARVSGNNAEVNPYLGLAGLQSMADLVSRAMMDDETAKTLSDDGVSNYRVQFDAMSAGPVLIIQAEAASQRQAGEALAAVAEQVPRTLSRLQSAASISPTYYITAAQVARPSAPVRSGKAQLRAVAAALAGGLVVSLLAVSILDAVRRRRQAERPAATTDAAPLPPPSSDTLDRAPATAEEQAQPETDDAYVIDLREPRDTTGRPAPQVPGIVELRAIAGIFGKAAPEADGSDHASTTADDADEPTPSPVDLLSTKPIPLFVPKRTAGPEPDKSAPEPEPDARSWQARRSPM